MEVGVMTYWHGEKICLHLFSTQNMLSSEVAAMIEDCYAIALICCKRKTM